MYQISIISFDTHHHNENSLLIITNLLFSILVPGIYIDLHRSLIIVRYPSPLESKAYQHSIDIFDTLEHQCCTSIQLDFSIHHYYCENFNSMDRHTAPCQAWCIPAARRWGTGRVWASRRLAQPLGRARGSRHWGWWRCPKNRRCALPNWSITRLTGRWYLIF